MTDSKHVCCCGVDIWTKVIAYIQIIFAGLSGVILFLAIIYFKLLGGGDEGKGEDEVDNPYNPEAKIYQFFGFGMLIALLVVIGISFVMGLMLLKGANERNPKFLSSWLVYAIVGLALNIVLKVISIAMNTSGVFADVFLLCAGIAWSSFLIWVVHTFKREIQREYDEEGGLGGGGGAAYKSY